MEELSGQRTAIAARFFVSGFRYSKFKTHGLKAYLGLYKQNVSTQRYSGAFAGIVDNEAGVLILAGDVDAIRRPLDTPYGWKLETAVQVPSRTIAPAWSTTQIDVCFNDTSSPT